MRLRRETEEGKEPSRAYGLDTGYDLVVTRHVSIQPGHQALLPTALSMELPENTWGLVLGRSSTMYRRRLYVNPGVVDCGYRGEIQILVMNMGPKVVFVAEGDKVAQLILLPRINASFYMVERLDTLGDRGEAGFGSTDVTQEVTS